MAIVRFDILSVLYSITYSFDCLTVIAAPMSIYCLSLLLIPFVALIHVGMACQCYFITCAGHGSRQGRMRSLLGSHFRIRS